MRQHYLLVCLFLLPFVGRANPGYGSIEFVPNKGQWEGPFLFKAMTPNSDIYLEKNCFTFSIGAADNIFKIRSHKNGVASDGILHFHAYKVIFEGANPSPEIIGSKAQSHYYNYFLGNDKTKWATGIHPFYAVDYKNLYNNIDLHISTGEAQMKYDFIVHPGSDPAVINLGYKGTDGLSIKDGKLQIATSVGTVEEQEPYAYQYTDNGERKKVNCKYRIKDNAVSYIFPSGYDQTRDLVIDPSIVFATFTGSTSDNWGFTATYDNQGNFYAGGIVSGGGYPVQPPVGAFQTTFAGGSTTSGSAFPCDISISKFNAAGTALIYGTYIGGGNNEQPHSLVTNAAGNLIIAGRTYSTNYPVTLPGNTNSGGADLVVTVLNPTGTGLVASRYIGGSGDDVVNNTANEFGWGGLKHNYGDDARSEVITDNSGNIYVAGCTQSSNFPTVNATQSTLSGTQDAVVLKLDAGLNILWSTLLGGSGEDAAYVLALNNAQTQLFVSGGTMSGSFFPASATTGSLQPSYQGSADGFVARFQNSGTYPLQKATYIGTPQYDQCYGIQIDIFDSVYVMGQTLGSASSSFFTPSPGVWSVPNSSQFIMKLDNNLTKKSMNTLYGSGDPNNTNISPVAFLVDTCQNIYISGWGGDIYSPNFTPPPGTGSTNGMPLSTINAPDQSTTDGHDFYFIVVSRNMQSLLYSTYMGSNGGVGEHVDGGTSRFDRDGVVYQAICGGCGGSSAFPTKNALHPTNGSTNCNLIALKIAFNLGAVSANAKVVPDAVLCLGESVQLQNLSANGTSYEWDFGDGSPVSTAQTPPAHTYTSVGQYKVRLIVTNPNACKVHDTDYVNVSVDTVKIKANFTATITDNCKPYKIQITNNSSYSKTPGAQSFTKFMWDFGDGKTATGTNPGHEYADTGTYTITLTMIDTTACNSPDTIHKTVHFSNIYVKAGFILSDLCEKNDIDFPNSSQNATTYLWDFGDGDTSTAATPSHRYDTTGSYKVTLIAYNSASCNKADTMSLTVNVKDSPIADFDFTPKNSVDTNERNNKPYYFTNLSQRAEVYRWNFGDNTGSEDKTPTPHYYKKRGSYTVCLAAKNSLDCWDTVCKKIDAIVYPLVDLPTAFTPNGDGNNDVFYVRGGGIDKVTLKIYNRWGQKVFEATDVDANDPTRGWDGTYQGKQQEMDAYAFIMSGYFIDGTTFYKKGNVTLIR